MLGLETALNLIVSGETVASEVLAKMPGQKLIDKLVEGDVVDGARSRSRRRRPTSRPLPLIRDLKVVHPNAQALLCSSRATRSAR